MLKNRPVKVGDRAYNKKNSAMCTTQPVPFHQFDKGVAAIDQVNQWIGNPIGTWVMQ